MNHFSTGLRRALGIAVAGIGLTTATASFAATTLTVWCWDPNFNGVTMRQAGEIYAKTHPDVALNVIDTTSQHCFSLVASQACVGSEGARNP